MAMWPDHEEHGTRIDAAIDEAARQMTDGAPGGDLKARVLARIGERESFSRGWRLAWIMAPVAAAAIIVLIVAGRSFQRGNQKVGPAQPPSVETARQQPQPATTQSASQTQTTQMPNQVHAPAPVRPPTQVRLKPDATDVATDVTTDVAALAAESLDVESIDLAALPPAVSIRLAPLETIEPIDVAPLAASEIDEPQRRDQ
jgi:hypothetical protein